MGSPEIAIHKLIKNVQSNKDISDNAIKSSIQNIIQLHVNDLSKSSNIIYNPTLAEQLIDLTNFQELRDSDATEYTLRKCMREILKLYFDETKRTQGIKITNTHQFGYQMTSLGLNLGFASSSSERSLVPDGNVIVLSATVIACLLIFAFKPSSK